MTKPYTVMLREDFLPYLYRVDEIYHKKYKYRYTFNVSILRTNNKVYEYFIATCKKYKCWTHVAKNFFIYNTDSDTLKKLFDNRKLKNVEDIPTRTLDAMSYMDNPLFKQEYPASFVTKKENEMEVQMKTDKFSVKHTMNINVNDKQFNLENPATPSNALIVVLELSERLNSLNDQVNALKDLSDTSNITTILNDEITSITKFIEFINSNIK